MQAGYTLKCRPENPFTNCTGCHGCLKEIESKMNEYTFAVEDELLKGRRWEDVVFGLLSTYQSGSIELPSFGRVEVETRKTDRDDINSYGEYEQGSLEDIYVIFKVAGRFYKKLGTADSYGRATWDGKFREVVPVTKTVKVYEWE